MRGIEQQFLSLQKGFHELIPANLLRPFDERELELLIGGICKIDTTDWQSNTRLKVSNFSSLFIFFHLTCPFGLSYTFCLWIDNLESTVFRLLLFFHSTAQLKRPSSSGSGRLSNPTAKNWGPDYCSLLPDHRECLCKDSKPFKVLHFSSFDVWILKCNVRVFCFRFDWSVRSAPLHHPPDWRSLRESTQGAHMLQPAWPTTLPVLWKDAWETDASRRRNVWLCCRVIYFLFLLFFSPFFSESALNMKKKKYCLFILLPFFFKLPTLIFCVLFGKSFHPQEWKCLKKKKTKQFFEKFWKIGDGSSSSTPYPSNPLNFLQLVTQLPSLCKYVSV